MEKIPLYQARKELPRFIHEAENGKSIEITRHGKTAAIIMGEADYQALLHKGHTLDLAVSEWKRDYGDDGKDFSEAFEDLRSPEPGRKIELE